ncbi:hypothetical protein CPB83DRAFT_844591 [Crepidotus variabilis]|uniref:Fatty acid hydroxylase domain-containing protein n=1 Tax=Crepidotus variabilis TaxID=179855 RepID=A0A9P6EPW2_9AGAR|nr:hypothetical protein CPB83DRAFT_844591 [Crepidotus variabilis]
MDLVLSLFDEYVLDTVYARLVPLSAFASSVNSAPGLSSKLFLAATDASSSPWTRLVSRLPHPELKHEYLAPLFNATMGSGSATSAHAFSDISAWPRDYIPRQLISLTAITMVGIHVLYFLFAWISYTFIFNHDMMRHPKFLKNQVKLEIQTSVKSFPGMMLLTLPFFFAEVRGYSMVYSSVDDYGWAYLIASVPLYLLFTDYGIYWIHRWLHLPIFYKYIHKPHHKWLVPTPFASHAFHPLDGFAQSIPYHVFVFVFPLHRVLFIGLFVAVNFWTIFIHDSDMVTGHVLEKFINGPAHHTLHHLYFTVNYGQYFTWADRWGGSYRQPEASLDPLLEVQALDKKAE